MKMLYSRLSAFFLLSLLSLVSTQSPCPNALTPTYNTPALAAGWQATLIARGLSRPRSIVLDSLGRLLVLQQGVGIVNLQFNDAGGTCLSLVKQTTVISSSDLNHGLQISPDGKTLYASSIDAVFSWPYDPNTMTLDPKSTLVTGMTNAGHNTRTILLSQKEPGWILASRGSAANIDAEAERLVTGHSQVKAFYIANLTSSSRPYDFTTQGRLMGWGLRNSVGIAEEPVTGGIFTVENSADEVRRSGADVHNTNPGEEMNFHGFLNASTVGQGGNYGYPNCLALWDTNIPNRGSMTVGSQFAVDRTAQTLTVDDAACEAGRLKPRLTFTSHMALLDMKFSRDGQTAYVSFHGSWNSPSPVGYKVSTISFSNGQPVAAPDSTTAAVNFFYNPDLSKCPGSCFRPVGLAVDGQGRLWVSSDATDEIWILRNTVTTS